MPPPISVPTPPRIPQDPLDWGNAGIASNRIKITTQNPWKTFMVSSSILNGFKRILLNGYLKDSHG
jgi:hypothetical protein